MESGAQPQDEPSQRSTSYRRVCQLASGGVGTVELAVREEGRFRRLYAVKRLRDVYREDDDFREMFLDEARIAGMLRHPNVVSVLDVGEDAHGPFLVMDYVDGVSAASLIRRSVHRSQPIPLQVCLRVAMEAAEGLHAAHELRDANGHPLQLVHRDVSPQNLLIGYDGITRVTDFGIAKALGRSTRTQTGVLKGKFGYMSPEQLRFEEPDRRSDIFSLGVLLFELASGERLYKNRDGMDGARRILNEPPPDLGDHRDEVPAELVQLLFGMLAKERDHRPPDARSVARALEGIVTQLVAEEGRVEVGAYVQDAFEDDRREQQGRVSAALASAEVGPISVNVDLTDAAEGTRTVQGRTRGRRWLGVAAAVLLLVAGVGTAGWWLAQDGEGAPPTEAASAPSAVTAVEDVGTEAGEASAGGAGEEDGTAPVASDETTPAGTGLEGTEGEDADDGEVSASDAERAAARRRARRRRERARSADMSGVPMWDWQ